MPRMRAIRISRCRAISTVRNGKNSAGVEFGHQASLDALLAEVRAARRRRRTQPADADDMAAHAAMAEAKAAFPAWQATPVEERAAMLERAADLMRGAPRRADRADAERRRQDARRLRCRSARGGRLLPLLRGRGAPRARAAADCPARPARATSSRYRGRGVFVCISPWNFPLSIFVGQVAAALAAGNTVAAKPAEQTPLIAAEAVRILHEAGVPPEALQARDRRRQDRRRAGGGPPHVRRGVHRLDRSRARDQSRARRQGPAHRAADRGDRRHQSDDRGRHRAAGAGHRRRRHLGVPLRRPALLGVAAAVRAGGRRRPHDRDDRGRGARAEARRSRAIRRPMSAR